MNKSTKLSCRAGLLLIALLVSLLSMNCNRASKTLAEIGDEKVTLGEFEKQYLKTLSHPDSAKSKPLEDKKQFLNMYINFRLKVKDARDRGLLNNPELQKEIADYKRTFSPNYLIDKEVVEPELQRLYARKMEEIRASHILINLSEKPAPEDSIRAYLTADTIITKLGEGQDFSLLANQYSQDRTVKSNHGDLYYFTAGMTVDEFENAVYNMKSGEYTKKPVRTMFGLHIIKLTDRKQRLESIRAAHILLQDKRDSLGIIIDSVQTYQTAIDVFNKAKNGEDFSGLASQYSEDPGSKNMGGDLGFFDRRRLTQPLDSAVFVLRVGEVAGPIRTQYGWHIIKKTDEKPYQSFEASKEVLKNDYKRTRKFKDDYQKYVEKLKNDLNFKLNNDGVAYLKSKFDTAKTIADYNLDSLFSQSDKDRVIASFDGGTIKISDILNFQNVNRDYQRTPLSNETINSIINATAENPVLNKKAEDSKVVNDDEYMVTLKEYENGLLVFKVDQEELWTKVKLTDNELVSYYDANKTKYTKIDSTGASVFKSYDETKAEISNELQQVKFKEIEKSYLDALRAKYPVVIHEEVLNEAFKD
jgi:peptidyl-prolyl cis-trans isomerase SurA